MPRDAAAGLIHDVPHLDIRHEQQIRLPGHGVADRLVAGGLARERAVDRERPETTQPGIPRRATSRAVTVEGIFSDTVSTADKTATFGVSIPSACATGSVFSTIPICVSTSGLMLIAASVIRTIRPSYWKKPHWLSSRRPVCGIRPVSRFKIARAKSAVCSSPFISMSARPSRTVRTASFAASSSGAGKRHDLIVRHLLAHSAQEPRDLGRPGR